jgi:hypothetical protein
MRSRCWPRFDTVLTRFWFRADISSLPDVPIGEKHAFMTLSCQGTGPVLFRAYLPKHEASRQRMFKTSSVVRFCKDTGTDRTYQPTRYQPYSSLFDSILVKATGHSHVRCISFDLSEYQESIS